MRVRRLRSPLALTIAGMTGMAFILTLALASGLPWLADPPARGQPQPECGTYGDHLEVWDPAVVTPTPDSGPAGSPLEVGLSNILPNDVVSQPAEVLWDWNPELLEGELIGSGAVPQGQTSVTIEAAVPGDAEPGWYPVTVCWWYSLSETWYYRSAPFEVTEPTPEPTPEPTETPTPEPTETPTPGSQCGTYGRLEPYPDTVVILIPNMGAPGSSLEVELADVEPNPDADQPTEVLWDWDPGPGGDLIGSGAVPQHEPWAMIEARVPEGAEPGEHTATACWWYSLNETWYYKDATFHVSESEPTPEPTPTYEPTPTPTPTEGEMHNCPPAGKWSIAVWTGPNETETGAALAACGDGGVDFAYYLDPCPQTWKRYFLDRPEISNLPTLTDKQGVIAHGKVAPVPTTPTPTPTPMGPTPTPTPTPTPAPTLWDMPGEIFNCPRPGKWSIAVWTGPDGADIGEALSTCGEGAVDSAYYIDPGTQGWLRHFSEREEISNLQTLNNGHGVIAHGTPSVTPSVGPQGRIAYRSGYFPDFEIYVMNADGSGQTNVSNSPGLDMMPAWSPGGYHIAFTSERDGDFEIYEMNADGSGQTNLTNNPMEQDWSPAWSPDFLQIAFISDRDGDAEIYVMRADGMEQTNLTKNSAHDSDPAWSPDGSKIAFTSNRDGAFDIYVMSAAGFGQTNLTNNPMEEDLLPAWSPDGSQIAFTSERDGDFEIYVMNADGSGQTNLTNYPMGQDWSPAWSPDGCQIAFTSSRDGNDEIYVMNADGTDQTRLTNNSAVDDDPAWTVVPPGWSW